MVWLQAIVRERSDYLPPDQTYLDRQRDYLYRNLEAGEWVHEINVMAKGQDGAVAEV